MDDNVKRESPEAEKPVRGITLIFPMSTDGRPSLSRSCGD